MVKKKFGVAAQAEGIHATCNFYFPPNLGFGQVVLEKSQNLSKNLHKNRILVLKKFVLSCLRQMHFKIALFFETKISDFRGLDFEKLKKFKIFAHRLFRLK